MYDALVEGGSKPAVLQVALLVMMVMNLVVIIIIIVMLVVILVIKGRGQRKKNVFFRALPE